MSAPDNTRRPGRRLSADEQHLWGDVARSVAPLRRTRTPEMGGSQDILSPLPARKIPASLAGHLPSLASPPPLAPIDRRARQKLARGRDMIDARVDLHGMTQAQAHGALRRFLLNAQAEGARYVLIVTGKGRDPEHGVLRRQVPLWLGLPEFRTLVVGFDTAHVGHGGEGALYVRVRKRR
jgi:DNA-nicking Smr family endonuclease